MQQNNNQQTNFGQPYQQQPNFAQPQTMQQDFDQNYNQQYQQEDFNYSPQPEFQQPADNPPYNQAFGQPYQQQPNFAQPQPMQQDFDNYQQENYNEYNQDDFAQFNQYDTNNQNNAEYLNSQTGEPNIYEDNTSAIDSEVGDQKQGNKNIFIFVAAGIIALLLLVSGALFFLSSQENTDQVNVSEGNVAFESSVSLTQDSQNSISGSDDQNTNNTATEDLLGSDQGATAPAGTFDTGGPSTFASRARVYNVNTIPTSWLRQNFPASSLDENGECKLQYICGNRSDPDSDNASNLVEYNFNLNPQLIDTDEDGLADGDELFVYYTDPNNEDTDTDGFEDGTELVNCYDPSIKSLELNQIRQNQIESKIPLLKSANLSVATDTTLRNAGAVDSDIARGYIASKCLQDDTTNNSSNNTNVINNSIDTDVPQSPSTMSDPK